MKIKLDENLPFRLVSLLQAHGHEVDTVPDEQLTGSRIQIFGTPPVPKSVF